MRDEYLKNLFFAGKAEEFYHYLGAHLLRDGQNNIISTIFRLYAPHAKKVSLLCELNNFTGNQYPLSKDEIGIWEISFDRNLEWMMYKFQITTSDNQVLEKTDPYGFYAEARPGTASKVYDIDGYKWNDYQYLSARTPAYQKPLNIYEMHLGSWIRKSQDQFYSFNELVPSLIDYLELNNFTHVEFLPIYEHPLDMSWGYQGGTYYSVTSRYGTPKDLMYLIDQLHQRGIGVIIDFVLGHIVKDASYLYNFDGTHLYEYEDAKRRENIGWGTANLDFSKGITKTYMLSAFHFYLNYFHVDGFRIDAVSNLLYYLGDKSQGRCEEAISFIQDISRSLFAKDPSVIFSAEDSTDFSHVTGDANLGAVGFNYKWNMGFMNDTLKYFELDPIYRKFHHHNLTFGMMYAYSEQFILPFSHDEVVHLKHSLIGKMPGTYEEKFQQLKLLMTYFYTFPGKKLLFMGAEFGQFSEWNYEKALDWSCLDFASHQGYAHFFKSLTYLYKTQSSLWKWDFDPRGFSWVEADNAQKSIYAYLRFSDDDEPLFIILNMTNQHYANYRFGLPIAGDWEMMLDGTKEEFFGYSRPNIKYYSTKKGSYDNQDNYLEIDVYPWACYILKLTKHAF
ncbi:MAG: 1,4-alpha-glucan branching protein GlgB [Acholeplasmatales bacterium]|jgi:1,4-alpha-glucan branching enzyme|nr:1,4-alpha-glucan branching protein GlgB [Acholeplasmatales bacterium]